MADLSAWSFAWSSGSTFTSLAFKFAFVLCGDMVVVGFVVGMTQMPLYTKIESFSSRRMEAWPVCDMRDMGTWGEESRCQSIQELEARGHRRLPSSAAAALTQTSIIPTNAYHQMGSNEQNLDVERKRDDTLWLGALWAHFLTDVLPNFERRRRKKPADTEIPRHLHPTPFRLSNNIGWREEHGVEPEDERCSCQTGLGGDTHIETWTGNCSC